MIDPALKLLARFTARREGIVLVPYRDGDGWSIGGGHHLGKFASPPQMTITVADAFEMLPQDIEVRAAYVAKRLKVPVESHQLHALVDLYYQGGTDGLNAVAKIINARDPDDPQSVLASDREAAREFLNWDTTARGDHLTGLLGRRGRNVAMFTSAEYGSDLDRIPLWRRVSPSTGKVLYSEMEWYDVTEQDLPARPH
jgi:GH24 family phage-related lysozyme (muramidase)